jgi:gas vesicle protein
MIDEREPGTEAAAIAVARARTKGRTPATESPSPSESTDTPPSLPAPTDAPPRLADRRNGAVPDRRPGRANIGLREDNADFPVRLAREMQAAAKAYRARLAEEVELRRVAILAGIRDERRADVLRARQEVAKNRRAVDAWAATAQRQIKTERQRRKVELEADLRRTLRDQNRDVDRRVKAVEEALAAHKEALEAFFDAIEHQRDPEEIARHALQKPAFPELDEPAAASAVASPAAAKPTKPAKPTR